MNFLYILKQIFEKLNVIHGVFDIPVSKQQSFLEKLPEPKDDLERSYCQYRCQIFLMRKGVPFLLNCMAFLLLPIYFLRLHTEDKHVKEDTSNNCATVLFAGNRNVIPDSLKTEFEIIQIKDFQSHLRLDQNDKDYLRKVRKRYPFAFYFCFKCMMKIAMYSSAIASYAPKAVICSEEYSFTSSLLTDYCHRKRVEHINFMHGDKEYYIRDSFFRFDRFYVWTHHVINLFSDLRAPVEQFLLERPQCLYISNKYTELEPVDYTYYLQIESATQVERILRIMSILRERGAKVALRPHPLYNDHTKFLYQDSRGFIIEHPEEITIEDSLLRTGCAIARYSTVLFQAVCNGIPIVIDDISIPDDYKRLKDIRFICLNMVHRLLSELLD